MSETKVLFRLSDDEFVNEAVAELVRRANLNDEQISPTEVRGTEEDLRRIFTEIDLLLETTHRRTTDVRYVNYHTDNSISSASSAFPDDSKVAPKGEITDQYLKNHGIPTDDFPDSSSSVYSKRPYFTGAAHAGQWSTDRLDRCKSILMDVLFGDPEDFDIEHSCRNCSRDDLPNWKYDGDNITYNQKSAPYVTKSGARILGQGNNQDSSYRGRCVACIVAGFVYSLIPKPFYTEEPGTYRIYAFKSDFEGLLAVRKSLCEKSAISSESSIESGAILEKIDADSDPTADEYRKTLPSNLPTSTNADQGQLLSLLSRLNKATYTAEYSGKYGAGGKTLSQDITGATAYRSSNSKGGQPVRGITSMTSYAFDNQTTPNIQSVLYIDKVDEDTEKRFYPHQLIETLSQIQETSEELDLYTQQIDRVAEGILSGNIGLIESGLSELAKRVVNQTASAPITIDLFGIRKYLNMVFANMTELTDDDIEALTEVGSNLGQIFDTRDDVSVLIGLKNANQPQQMLQQMEQAGMEGLKKAVVRGDTVPRYNAVRQDDLETVLKLLTNPDTFEDAKSVLVSHASFASMYANSVSNNDNNDGD